MSNNTYRLEVSDHPHPGVLIIEFTYSPKGWLLHDRRSDSSHLCAPSAERILKRIFSSNNRCYPNTFFKHLQHVWDELNDKHLSKAQAETYFAELSNWISQTNISSTSF